MRYAHKVHQDQLCNSLCGVSHVDCARKVRLLEQVWEGACVVQVEANEFEIGVSRAK